MPRWIRGVDLVLVGVAIGPTAEVLTSLAARAAKKVDGDFKRLAANPPK